MPSYHVACGVRFFISDKVPPSEHDSCQDDGGSQTRMYKARCTLGWIERVVQCAAGRNGCMPQFLPCQRQNHVIGSMPRTSFEKYGTGFPEEVRLGYVPYISYGERQPPDAHTAKSRAQ